MSVCTYMYSKNTTTITHREDCARRTRKGSMERINNTLKSWLLKHSNDSVIEDPLEGESAMIQRTIINEHIYISHVTTEASPCNQSLLVPVIKIVTCQVSSHNDEEVMIYYCNHCKWQIIGSPRVMYGKKSHGIPKDM